MRPEFVNEYNQLMTKDNDNRDIIKKYDSDITKREVIGVDKDSLNHDFHQIAISILKENDEKKIFVLKKDRTRNGSMIFIDEENKVVECRLYKHKHIDSINWIDNDRYCTDESLFGIMPKSFTDMTTEINNLTEKYKGKITNIFFEEKTGQRYYNNKKPQTIFIKNTNFTIYNKCVNYGRDTKFVPIKIISMKINAYMEYMRSNNFKFNIKIYTIDDTTSNNDEKVEVSYDYFPALTNDELFNNMKELYSKASKYCDEWYKKRMVMHRQIQEIIKKYGYLDVLVASRI